MKIHEPKYEIVINDVPIDDPDPDDPKTVKTFETINNLPSGIISKIIFFRRKNKECNVKTFKIERISRI